MHLLHHHPGLILLSAACALAAPQHSANDDVVEPCVSGGGFELRGEIVDIGSDLLAGSGFALTGVIGAPSMDDEPITQGLPGSDADDGWAITHDDAEEIENDLYDALDPQAARPD